MARFNHHHNYNSLAERDRVRYFLFVSAWTTLLLPMLMGLFMFARNSILASVLTHLILYVYFRPSAVRLVLTSLFYSLFITWVLWLTASAALTQSIGGGLSCHNSPPFVYCNQLNALAAFGWMNWYVLGPQLQNCKFLTSISQDPSHSCSLYCHSARNSNH